ncbi:MAG: CoB--CoM heterodisulfide reductase iron-sulfur subunit B family protein [Thermodesulfobacteriota bacterium]
MKPKTDLTPISYFPGCSMATTARENNQTLIAVCDRMGMDLLELPDWNCCGSSSTHSINTGLAFQLACRNLSLAPAGRPLLAACPSCYLRLKTAHEQLKADAAAREDYERRWKRPVDDGLDIVSFFEILADKRRFQPEIRQSLNGLRFAPYYGCMLSRPPILRTTPALKNAHFGLMEKVLTRFGAEPTSWNHATKCCGTFLSAARPEVAASLVDRIMQDAVAADAECLVTACAMCHLNLEIRCRIPDKRPVFHFSELLAVAYGIPVRGQWFKRHLIDPMPLLRSRGIA